MKFKRGDKVRVVTPIDYKPTFISAWEGRVGTIGATWKPERPGDEPDYDVILDPVDEHEREELKRDPHFLRNRLSSNFIQFANGVEVMVSLL